MERPRFFTASNLVNGALVALSDEEAHHAKIVLRLKDQSEVALIDGKGNVGAGTLSFNGKKGQVQLTQVQAFPMSNRVSLAFGIPKGAALEILLRKATEIGVLSFQPLITDHSLHPDHWNAERWQRVLLEATKQCQDPWLPALAAPKSLSDFLAKHPQDQSLIYCDEAQREAAPPFLKPGPVTVLIGAEGGWSQREREMVASKGPVILGLGKNRLRAETAALVAVTLVKSACGEY